MTEHQRPDRGPVMHALDGGDRAELVDSNRPFAWVRSDLVVDVRFMR